jgi:protein-S-isoprenylcysteine O-methyltransferase Ste14
MNNDGNSFLGRGGVWVVLQFVLLSAVIFPAVFLRGDWSHGWMTVLGVALFLVGAGFGIGGACVLGKARTAFPKPKEDSSLIRHGIYARVRHPLYTAVILLSFGWAFIWQSGLALAVAGAQVPFFVAKARREERWLREQFPDYVAYAERVPRFIPRLWQLP